MKPISGLVGLSAVQGLFLCSLFFYPLSFADHTLYMIPQVLFLALGLILLPTASAENSKQGKLLTFALGLLTCTLAILREVLADQAAYLEPLKLFVNISTLILFLFLLPVFEPITCARWLKRFALAWLVMIVGAYAYVGTSMWQMVLLLIEPNGVTSTRLYELAEPLGAIFLTKNILAMYFVAVFGCFLYFRRSAGTRVTLVEKAIFVVLCALPFSRQAFLSVVVLLAADHFFCRDRAARRWAVVVLLAAGLIIGLFLTYAFDFSSQEDGATTRLELWKVFFANWTKFGALGLGTHQMNASLDYLDIDNYHMFFMNQIADYGLVHCLTFNLLLLIVTFNSTPPRSRWLLIIPFWLNVCFQTFGYEFGNLFLFCIAANSCNLRLRSPRVLSPMESWASPAEANG